jgi:hypothetical protein
MFPRAKFRATEKDGDMSNLAGQTMQHLSEALSAIPSILRALNDNPRGAETLITLAVLALAGYAIHKRK